MPFGLSQSSALQEVRGMQHLDPERREKMVLGRTQKDIKLSYVCFRTLCFMVCFASLVVGTLLADYYINGSMGQANQTTHNMSAWLTSSNNSLS